MEGLRARYGDPAPAEARRARGDGARRHRPDGLQRLLPDRLGLRALRQGQRHRRRPGPRLGGRLDRRLLPARSPTSTRCATTCSSSASSTPSACRCRTSTSTSRCAAASASCATSIEKYGRESVAQIVTFGKMFPRAATRDAARVLGHDYGVGDRLAKLIPDPIMGRAPSLRGLPEGRRAAARGLRLRPDGQADRRRRASGLEGIVRNSSIHAAAVVIAERAADRHRAAAARRRQPGRRATATSVFKHRHAVLDEARRGARPAEDGLPRACATSTSSRTRWTSSSARRGARPDMTTLPLDDASDLRDARRAATRSACSSSSPRACSEALQQGPPDGVRRPRRARRAVPAGRDGPDPDLRARQARPATGHRSPTSACEPIIGPT